MKTFLKLTLAIVTLVACCAAVSSFNRPVVPYNPEQIKGSVRVVLLRVDRTTVFSDEGFRTGIAEKFHAIPGLSVAYLVEFLGDEPVKSGAAVHSDGKLARLNGNPVIGTRPENLSGGGQVFVRDYEQYGWGMLKKPAVTNPKRTQVVERWERGLRIPDGKLDLHFTTGFNDHREGFVFENVPIE